MELSDNRFVPDADRIFLLPEEVPAAIREDLEQYAPQPHLLMNLSTLLLGPGQAVADKHRRGIWIRSDPGGKMQLLDYGRLGRRLCEALSSDPPPLERLADICRMVFRGRAVPGRENGLDGVWIETGMAAFACIRCGHCCREVGYPKEADRKDVARWKAAGRVDILRWVGHESHRGDRTGCRIWIDPATGRPADTCPWLFQVPGSHLHGCRIHDDKPEICRLYPGSRKHGGMTGCRGFDERAKRKNP